jgi:hypothetical protein
MLKEVVGLIKSQSFWKATVIAFPLDTLICILSGIILLFTNIEWVRIVYTVTAWAFLPIAILFIIAQIGNYLHGEEKVS